MTRRTRLGGALAVAGALVLGACSSPEPTEYSEDIEENFVSACVDAPEGDERLCQCAYESLEAQVPFEEFREIEETVEEGGEVPTEVTDLFAQCAVGGPLPADSTTTTEG